MREESSSSSTTINNNNNIYCIDPNAVLSDAELVDLFIPCGQELALTVPLFIVTQLTLFIIFAFLRKCCLRRSNNQGCGCCSWGDGMDENDIDSILSSRRNPYTSYPTTTVNDKESIKVQEVIEGEEKSDDAHREGQQLEQKAESATSNIGKSNQQEVNNNNNNTPEPPPIDESTGKQRFSLQYLMLKYGDKKLRYTDSIPRKTMHFTSALLLALQLQLITQTFVLNFQSAFLGATCVSIILALSNLPYPPSISDSWLATHIYGALSRTRDGIYGRKNILVAYTGTTCGILVSAMLAYSFVIPHFPDDNAADLQMLISVLYYAPLAVGDALGELIGGPFGGTFFPTFRVKGFGEINKKSVEGCLAVFLGSFGSCTLVSYSYGVMSTKGTTSSWILLCFLLGVTTTIVETIAFRSTDNFLIPVFNVLVLMVAFGVSSLQEKLF